MYNVTEEVQKFLKTGKETESRFANDLVEVCGGETELANESDDINNHIDVYWKQPDSPRIISFDVKGLRKNKRTDNNFSYTTTWLELQNVNGGPGSMYGKCDYLVFEGENDWFICNRQGLLDDLLSKITDDTIYTDNPGMNFKKYQRQKWGRKDIIVRVPFDFVVKNSKKTIKKVVGIN